VDAGSAAPRALGKGERQPTRVEVAVAGQECGAEHAVGDHQRKSSAGFVGADELER